MGAGTTQWASESASRKAEEEKRKTTNAGQKKSMLQLIGKKERGESQPEDE